MITLVDTNVLLDVFLPDPGFGEKSLKSLEKGYQQGSLIINEIIYAELAPQFETKDLLDNTLTKMGIQTLVIDKDTAYDAGRRWKKYRKAGARTGNRILADFLIGAHALSRADALLSRDRGFYKKYFTPLKVLY